MKYRIKSSWILIIFGLFVLIKMPTIIVSGIGLGLLSVFGLLYLLKRIPEVIKNLLVRTKFSTLVTDFTLSSIAIIVMISLATGVTLAIGALFTALVISYILEEQRVKTLEKKATKLLSAPEQIQS